MYLSQITPYETHGEPGWPTIFAVIGLIVACDIVALLHLRAATDITPAQRKKWLLLILLLPFVGAAVYSMSRHKHTS